VYKAIFDPGAEKEFLQLETKSQNLVATKIRDLKENNLLLISVIRVAHRKEVY